LTATEDDRIKKYADKLMQLKKTNPAWNKGVPNPLAADNGKRGAAKQSEKVTGRKIKVNPDGTRTWVYPSK
jgi:hypothetical protein